MAIEVEKQNKNTVTFLKIINGKFTKKVTKNTPDAVYRKFIDSNEVQYDIYELKIKSVSGIICGLETVNGKYGEALVVKLQDGNEKIQITISVKSRYFTDICKKLPNIDFDKEIKLAPYDFIPDTGTRLIGITIHQDGSKVSSYYWDPIEKKSIKLPISDIAWTDMTDTQKAKANLNRQEYFIESIKLLAKEIPEEINTTSSSTSKEGQDNFFEQAATGHQPDLG